LLLSKNEKQREKKMKLTVKYCCDMIITLGKVARGRGATPEGHIYHKSRAKCPAFSIGEDEDGFPYEVIQMPGDPHYWSTKHKAWRGKVLRKDKYLCQRCLRYGKHTAATHAHHKQPRELFPELQYDIDNGEALCTPCHNIVEPRL
jgi:hypothetical protein